MFPASFDYVAAHSVEEALQLLTKHGEDAKLLAGGHSLIPAMKLRLSSPRTLIDLGTVSGLRGVRDRWRYSGDRRANGARRCRFIGAGAEASAGVSGRSIGDR